jgi:hypothetical protein
VFRSLSGHTKSRLHSSNSPERLGSIMGMGRTHQLKIAFFSTSRHRTMTEDRRPLGCLGNPHRFDPMRSCATLLDERAGIRMDHDLAPPAGSAPPTPSR